ncbi:hypothetical protein D3C78_1188150 [compost metagenome]
MQPLAHMFERQVTCLMRHHRSDLRQCQATGCQQTSKIIFDQCRRLAEQLFALHMEQEIAVSHAGARVAPRPPGTYLAQLATFRIGLHQAGQNTAAAVATLDDGAGRAVAKNQRGLFMLPVNTARSQIG